jgi:hypothetical protein
MTYNQKFVAVVKSNGKILREHDDTVSLPFGSEYSILLKNLNSKKALVKIDIDGKSIGSDLVVEGNSSVEVERFLENLNRGNKFRFIQKTQEIINHRGDKIDDGLVRIEVKYEADKPIHVDEYHHYHYDWYYHPYFIKPWPYTVANPNVFCSSVTNDVNVGSSTGTITSGNSTFTCSNSMGSDKIKTSYMNSVNLPLKDEGITVKGSESNQEFYASWIGTLEENSIVIILKLRGYKGSFRVQNPVTVKTKLICSTCGRHNPSQYKYCHNCGTYL